jgi:hypothetical protein
MFWHKLLLLSLESDGKMSLIHYLSHSCMSAIHVGFNYNGTQGVVFHILCTPMLPKYIMNKLLRVILTFVDAYWK